MDFEKTLADRPAEGSLRPAGRRLVVMRQSGTKAPFSPDGPLTWGEIDLVRTDVFTPALAGLLPDPEVRGGDRWNVSPDGGGEPRHQAASIRQSGSRVAFSVRPALARGRRARQPGGAGRRGRQRPAHHAGHAGADADGGAVRGRIAQLAGEQEGEGAARRCG